MFKHTQVLRDAAEKKAKDSVAKKLEYQRRNAIPKYSAFANLQPDFVDDAKRKYYLATEAAFPVEMKQLDGLTDKSDRLLFVLLPITVTKATNGELDFPDVSSGYLTVRRYQSPFNSAAAAPSASAGAVVVIGVKMTDYRHNRAIGMLVVDGAFKTTSPAAQSWQQVLATLLKN